MATSIALEKQIGKTLTVAKRTKSLPTDPRLLALMGVQGITEEIATSLLNKFGSIPNLLKTKVRIKDLMAIRGVGRVTARRLKELRTTWKDL